MYQLRATTKIHLQYACLAQTALTIVVIILPLLGFDFVELPTYWSIASICAMLLKTIAVPTHKIRLPVLFTHIVACFALSVWSGWLASQALNVHDYTLVALLVLTILLSSTCAYQAQKLYKLMTSKRKN